VLAWPYDFYHLLLPLLALREMILVTGITILVLPTVDISGIKTGTAVESTVPEWQPLMAD